ncbi:hypothetical protein EYF80_042210 [Liparis tanakae]|uniref:Uncharacterized protein n=1 Tax=Liparis tanakae TaxID=230148 RepID=A0A4Z2G273_9TELE|nr:hypothetical protein EYF80_042210 [Liparis tanakae]
METKSEVPNEHEEEGSQQGVETDTVISIHRSRTSRSSRSSTSSRVSLDAARARAKAEAAKTRFAFIEKENKLKIEKAKLEARIDSINLQREAEAANAEAVVLERAAADIEGSEGSKDMEILPFQECAQKRTYDYVTHHAQGPIEEKDVYPLQPILTSQHDDTAPAQLHIINRRPSRKYPLIALLVLKDQPKKRLCKSIKL